MTSLADALPVGVTHHRNPLTNTETWMADAACAGITPAEADRLFFPPHTFPAEAVQMCAGCPVQVQCERFACRVERGAQYTYGLWGALSPEQRRT